MTATLSNRLPRLGTQAHLYTIVKPNTFVENIETFYFRRTNFKSFDFVNKTGVQFYEKT